MVLTAGLGLIFAPINVAAYMYTPAHLRGSAIALVSLLRNEGGSVGTSMAQTIQQRRDQFHLARVNEFLDPLNPHVEQPFSNRPRSTSMQQTGDPVASHQMALQSLANLRQQQALSLAYFDIFWLAAVSGHRTRPVRLFYEAHRRRKGQPRRGGVAVDDSRYAGVAIIGVSGQGHRAVFVKAGVQFDDIPCLYGLFRSCRF